MKMILSAWKMSTGESDRQTDCARSRGLVVAGLVVGLVLAGCTASNKAVISGPDGTGDDRWSSSDQWRAGVMAWRERRLGRLTEPYGWLSLVGLDFVDDGQWRVGHSDQVDIAMPAGPALWGVLTVDGLQARFKPADDSVSVDGLAGHSADLLPPDRDEPVWVQAEDVRFQVIERNGRLAVRTRWPRAATRTGFTGLDYFEFDPDWRIDAQFEAHPAGTTMPVGSVLGDLTDEPNPGAAVFTVDGREFRLEAVADSDDEQLFFIFADRTSGRETYGAGRFLYADRPDADGRLVLDFNRAYNPPCVFTEYSTCPLPPPENRLDVRVTAGEKDYAGQSGDSK
ncbi:MAG: DUF1684 domain-containing protein [Pseudomonadota bacterium]|nr:MAG: DUF1684 domain-containing protein [Pseudomonadota bacterium]